MRAEPPRVARAADKCCGWDTRTSTPCGIHWGMQRGPAQDALLTQLHAVACRRCMAAPPPPPPTPGLRCTSTPAARSTPVTRPWLRSSPAPALWSARRCAPRALCAQCPAPCLPACLPAALPRRCTSLNTISSGQLYSMCGVRDAALRWAAAQLAYGRSSSRRGHHHCLLHGGIHLTWQ